MGGCCCCCVSRQADVTNLSPLYRNPTASEEREPLSNRSRVSALSTGLLVDTNLDTSIPDTYRPPPAPIPYEVSVGRQQPPPGHQESSGSNSEVVAGQPINLELASEGNSFNDLVTTVKDLKGSDNKVKFDSELSTEETVDDINKSGELKKSSQPIDSILEECPTCLEEYDDENPKITTKCEHHFHMACILEWLERSDTCPVCGQLYSLDNGYRLDKGKVTGRKGTTFLYERRDFWGSFGWVDSSSDYRVPSRDN